MEDKTFIRGDFIFSYWVFAWFVLYYAARYARGGALRVPNPFIALCIGVAENAILATAILLNRKWKNFAIFTTSAIVMKLIPIWLLWREPIQPRRDLFFTAVLFFIYLIWLYIHRRNVVDTNKQVMENVVAGNSNTPLFAFVNWATGSRG